MPPAPAWADVAAAAAGGTGRAAAAPAARPGVRFTIKSAHPQSPWLGKGPSLPLDYLPASRTRHPLACRSGIKPEPWLRVVKVKLLAEITSAFSPSGVTHPVLCLLLQWLSQSVFLPDTTQEAFPLGPVAAVAAGGGPRDAAGGTGRRAARRGAPNPQSTSCPRGSRALGLPTPLALFMDASQRGQDLVFPTSMSP